MSPSELNNAQYSSEYTPYEDQGVDDIHHPPQHQLLNDLLVAVNSLGASISHLQVDNLSLQATITGSSPQLHDKINHAQTKHINAFIKSVHSLECSVRKLHSDNTNLRSFLVETEKERMVSVPITHRHFPQFDRLPKELRRMIWKTALTTTPQTLTMINCLELGPSQVNRTASTCKEAMEVLGELKLDFIDSPIEESKKKTPCYFNPEIDTLLWLEDRDYSKIIFRACSRCQTENGKKEGGEGNKKARECEHKLPLHKLAMSWTSITRMRGVGFANTIDLCVSTKEYLRWFKLLYDFSPSKLVLFIDDNFYKGEEDRFSALGLASRELNTKTPVVFITPPEYLLREHVLSGGVLGGCSSWKEAGEKVQLCMLEIVRQREELKKKRGEGNPKDFSAWEKWTPPTFEIVLIQPKNVE